MMNRKAAHSTQAPPRSASVDPDVSGLIVITGIMGAGKSAVAQAVAERLPRSVHLRGDIFRRMIVNGRAEMSATPTDAALELLRLRYRIAALAADEYLAAGFTVVYQDVILGTYLDDVLSWPRAYPAHGVVLCPRPEVAASRDASRAKMGYRLMDVRHLDRVLRTETPRRGLWLDNSDLTVDQTADTILTRLDEARIAPPPAATSSS